MSVVEQAFREGFKAGSRGGQSADAAWGDAALRMLREEVMNWLPDSAEGDAVKAKIIHCIDASLTA